MLMSAILLILYVVLIIASHKGAIFALKKTDLL
jgi:hemin uptake protein HemP